jgi:hypothetical protein
VLYELHNRLAQKPAWVALKSLPEYSGFHRAGAKTGAAFKQVNEIQLDDQLPLSASFSRPPRQDAASKN